MQRPRLRQVPRQSLQDYGTLLRRCQVVNKPVISTISGKQLGLVSHFVVDPAQLTVVSLALRPKGFKQTLSGLVDLSTVEQIGDVVLVNRDSVSGTATSALQRGYQRLSGCEVFTYEGIPLGKVCQLLTQPSFASCVACFHVVEVTALHCTALRQSLDWWPVCTPEGAAQLARQIMHACTFEVTGLRLADRLSRVPSRDIHCLLPSLQVRNFSFRPDSGRIASVQYDELGLASIPESWVTLWEVGVEHVHTVEQQRLTLRQRSADAPLRLQEGSLGKLIAGSLVSTCLWPL